jgi:hypothetical protein
MEQLHPHDQLVAAIYRLRATRCSTMRFGFTVPDLIAAMRSVDPGSVAWVAVVCADQ